MHPPATLPASMPARGRRRPRTVEPRAAAAAVVVLAVFLSAACGGGTGAPPPVVTASSSPTPQAPTPDHRTPTTAPPAVSPTPLATGPTGDWTAGIRHAPGGRGTAVLQAVRAARHDSFDRVVFEFAAELPGYHLEYVDRPVRECGSGDTVAVAGDGWLEVRLEPARAHTEEGAATIDRRRIESGLPIVREVVRTCDFEGVVTWVIGTASPNRYRVATLQGPPRLVVDVRH